MIEIEQPTWHQDAQCVVEHVPVDTFYPERAEGLATRVKLSRLCIERCPVRVECLQEALDNHEFDGWWACTSPKERKFILNSGMSAAQFVKNQATGHYVTPGAGRPRSTWKS